MADATHPTHSSFLEGQRLLHRAVNAPVRAVLAYWLRLHDHERLPARERFNPLDLPSRILPHLFLLERGVGPHWRIRLLGSHLVAALGHDFTGRDLVDEQIPNISKSRTLRMLETVVATELPAHFHGQTEFRFRDTYGEHEQALLPFRRADTNTVDVVLGVIVYEGLTSVFGPGTGW